jgi:hypothetical protein
MAKGVAARGRAERAIAALGLLGILGFSDCGNAPPPRSPSVALARPTASASRRAPPPHVVAPRAGALPEPPAERRAWAPPANRLPKNLVSATRALFDEGLADPRGLDYREIEVTTGNVWGGSGAVTKTHGWVLPGPAGARRFAVTWNGLVYPVQLVGATADVSTDVRAAVHADQAAIDKEKKRDPGWTFYRFRNAFPEAQSVSADVLAPLQAALLLRLGRADLASLVWRQWTSGMRADTNDDAVHLRDPYLMLATDWTWALFDRAVCAHMRGDDELSLESATALVPIQGAVEAEAARRGFKHRQPYAKGSPPAPYLGFLGQLPELVADEERRVHEPKLPAPSAAELAKLPNAQARVDFLIADLDEVNARQMGQPGGVDLGDDPIVQALIAQGAPAVDPLLHVLESDPRLTRSVHFWRDFARSRDLISVGEAGYVALAGILDTSFFEPGSTGDDLTAHGLEGRRRVAARIRAYWNKWRGMPEVERWYRVLADDKESADHWLQSAASIAEPSNVSVTPGSMFGTQWTTTSSNAKNVQLRGEALRKKKQPNVTELMSRRVRELEKGQLSLACQMASALATWDARGGLPALRDLMQREIAASGTNQLPGCVADLTIARAHAGDRAALAQYAKWLGGVTPQKAGYEAASVLAPLWTFPNDPAIRAAASRLFDERRSKWVPFDATQTFEWDINELPLLRIPAFRRHALRMLSRTRVVGSAVVGDDHGLNITYKAGGASSGSYGNVTDMPPAGTQRTIRLCDHYASLISDYHGAPPFRVYWSRTRRDRALRDVRRYVASYK